MLFKLQRAIEDLRATGNQVESIDMSLKASTEIIRQSGRVGKTKYLTYFMDYPVTVHIRDRADAHILYRSHVGSILLSKLVR